MKKIILTFISFFLLINYGKAQQSSFGFTAGAAFASYRVIGGFIRNGTNTSKAKIGFTAGLTSSLRLFNNFSFEPALNFTQKGGTEKMQGSSNKLTLNYLELPLNFVYSISSLKGKFLVGAGPSVSMGLSGKEKYADGTNSESTDIKFGNGDYDEYKSFEAGINFLAGYRFKGGFLISANYNKGLTSIVEGRYVIVDGPSEIHNSYLGIRLGYIMRGTLKK